MPQVGACPRENFAFSFFSSPLFRIFSTVALRSAPEKNRVALDTAEGHPLGELRNPTI